MKEPLSIIVVSLMAGACSHPLHDTSSYPTASDQAPLVTSAMTVSGVRIIVIGRVYRAHDFIFLPPGETISLRDLIWRTDGFGSADLTNLCVVRTGTDGHVEKLHVDGMALIRDPKQPDIVLTDGDIVEAMEVVTRYSY